MRDFVDQVYVPDTLAIAGFYKDWGGTARPAATSCRLATCPRRPLGHGFLPHPAWCHPQPRPVQNPSHRSGQGRRDPGICQPLLVQVQRGRRAGPASVQGRDRTQLHRSEAALRAPGRGPEILLDQVAALEGQGHGSGPLGSRADDVRQRAQTDQGTGGLHPEDPGRAGHGAVLHAGPHRGAHAGIEDPGRCHAGLVRRLDRQHQGGRCTHLQRPVLGSVHLAQATCRAWA